MTRVHAEAARNISIAAEDKDKLEKKDLKKC